MAATGTTCPCCGEAEVEVFYRVESIPVNSVLLLDSRHEALDFPTGEMALGHCGECGFVYNTAFDPDLLEYSSRYEETQGFSPTFRAWHEALAARLVERYALHGKRIIEIGCGKGEFLRLLCELGDNHGLGFDPSYIDGREGPLERGSVEFVADFYGDKYTGLAADFVCCKMTLEHIPLARKFVSTVRRAVGDQYDTRVFFQVPNVVKILEDDAFWDVYYEHCSYFSMGSLARVFRASGFEVLALEADYDDQYIMVEARPVPPGFGEGAFLEEHDVERLGSLVSRFSRSMNHRLAEWNERLARYAADGERVVVWGSGSKGVAFLTCLSAASCVEHVVDINPHRHDHYMAKTGQRIVGPDALIELQPDVVIAMNPIYRDEIAQDLRARGLTPELLIP